MTKEEAKKKIQKLRDEINWHNYMYYVHNRPEISDYEFDMMLKELEKLEEEYPEFNDELSPTKRVGSDLLSGFEHVKHERPMLSLSNTYSPQEVRDWVDRVCKQFPDEIIDICAEKKYDGTSISLIYKNGALVRAVTRGDGVQGDDVTANVKTIKSVPLRLQPGNWPEEFEIRGEIVMPWDVFYKLNEEREAAGEMPFANPRNAASGTLKMLDTKEVARRKLYAVFYFVLGDNLPCNSHAGNLFAAKRWGFNTGETDMFYTTADFEKYISEMDVKRHSLPFATDGLVFKVDNMSQQEKLGFTAKSPRWAIAYKFNPEQACTLLEEVTFETGRMGTVTPVANLTPVQISGSVVKRATLHNEDYIKGLGLHKNDYVYVEKAGEIIPQITGVDLKQRTSSEEIVFPKYCASCGSELVRKEGEADWKCPNSSGCLPQILGKFEHFSGRKMMDISGLGPKTIELLFSKSLINQTSDLYFLTKDDLTRAGMGNVESSNLIAALEESKKQPFEKVLYALSIDNVGETTAKKIARHFGSMDTIIKAGIDEFTGIDDVGIVIAESIYNYMRKEENINNIKRLMETGLRMTAEAEKSATGNALAGKTIVISGVFVKHTRDEYKTLIEKNGGKNTSSVSKNTSFVLAGDDMGPSKKEKCEKLGIPMVTEYEFLKMIGES